MDFSCFKAYDIRGELGKNFDSKIVCRIASAEIKHFNAKIVEIGYDARETSERFAFLVAKVAKKYGSHVLFLGLSGTEEMYFSVSEYKACLGVHITASHNPINFNGIKFVKASSVPLDHEKDFKKIRKLAEDTSALSSGPGGKITDNSQQAREKYVQKVVSFISPKKFRPFRLVVNSGNGAAGPTFDSVISHLEKNNVSLKIFRMNHEPDSSFPKGVPNPLLEQNRIETSNEVIKQKADIGVAFDGDFDRCFFF